MQKAEHLRNVQTQWKNSRNQAWKENAELQNLIKSKVQRINDLEKVIKDFNLTGQTSFAIEIEETKQPPLQKRKTVMYNAPVFGVPQVQQNLRISIPENTTYQP